MLKEFFFVFLKGTIGIFLPFLILLYFKEISLFTAPYRKKEYFIPTEEKVFQTYLSATTMVLIVLLGIQFFSTQVTAWEWPAADNFPFFEIRQQPPRLTQDFFAQSSLQPNGRWGFQYFIWGMSKLFQTDYYNIFFFLKGLNHIFLLPLWFFVLAQALRKYQKLRVEGIFLLILCGILFLPIQKEISIAWWPFYHTHAIAENLAELLLIIAFSLDLVFSNKKIKIFLSFLVFFSTFIHPMTTFFMIIVYLTLSLLGSNPRRVLTQGLFFLLSFFVGFIAVQVLFQQPNINLNTVDFIEIYVKQSCPAHYRVPFFGSLSSLEWWQSLVLVNLLFLVPIGYLTFYRKQSFLLVFLGAAAVLELNFAILFQYLFIDIFPLKFVAQLGPSRFTTYSLVYLVAFYGMFLSAFFQGKPLFPHQFFIQKKFFWVVGMGSCLVILGSIPLHTDDPRKEIAKRIGPIIGWAATNTSSDSVFLIQPNIGYMSNDFPLLANRAAVVGSGFPFSEGAFKEFYERDVAVSGHWSVSKNIKGSWIGEKRIKFFQGLQEADILKIRHRFKADYLIEPAADKIRKFPMVFEDSKWRVYQIKEG